MLDLTEVRKMAGIDENREPIRKLRGEQYPCAICREPVPNPKKFVHLHYGGGTIILESEAAKADAECPGGDLGAYPVGPKCARIPELKEYLA